MLTVPAAPYTSPGSTAVGGTPKHLPPPGGVVRRGVNHRPRGRADKRTSLTSASDPWRTLGEERYAAPCSLAQPTCEPHMPTHRSTAPRCWRVHAAAVSTASARFCLTKSTSGRTATRLPFVLRAESTLSWVTPPASPLVIPSSSGQCGGCPMNTESRRQNVANAVASCARREHRRRRMIGVVLAVAAFAGPAMAHRSLASQVEQAFLETIAGRWVRVAEDGQVSSVESLELYCPSGRWVSQGKDRSIEGTYQFQAEGLCVSAAGRLNFCRALELGRDGSLSAAGEAARVRFIPVHAPQVGRDWDASVRCGNGK